MTRRYTGAEAREIAAKATGDALEIVDRDDGVYLLNRNREHPFYAQCVGARAVERAALFAAAPDLAESLAAVEAERAEAMSAYLAETAERDALRAAVREYLAAHFDERHADAAAFTAFWNTNNMLAPDYPEKCAAHSAARARWKDADEKRRAALAALREAAK